MFSKVEVLNGGNVLEVIDNYNQLSALLLDAHAQVPPTLINTSLNMTKGCNDTLGTIAGLTVGAGVSKFYTTTLLGSIQNIEFHANMIRLEPEVVSMIDSNENTT